MQQNARAVSAKDQRLRKQCDLRRKLTLEHLERRLCLAVPAFSSLPGADHTIFLDFDGQSVQGTSWNSYYNQSVLNAQPFNVEGDSSTYSPGELARIEEAWKRAAEDFRPFNINVTTVDPGIERLRKSGSSDSQWGVRVIVTNESTMVNNSAEYCGCGGIAYIDSFNWSSDTPVWVYTTGGKSIAEAASHEVGHSLGLSHDGLSGGESYYSGHGSGDTGFASIMGVGYYKNVSQWDRGEYYNSNNAGAQANYGDGPDDLALIVGEAGPGNGFGYRADDHANSDLSASSLGMSSATSVSDNGVIETASDVDVFAFTTGAGLVSLRIDPFTPGPNLDVKADLFDALGNQIATSNSSTVLSASLELNLSAGQYFLHIDGTGWGNPGSSNPSGYSDYASLGQYLISGSIVDPGGLPTVSVGDVSANEAAASITFALQLSAAAADTTSVSWMTSDASATAGLDYLANSGTAEFPAGATTALVTIDLLNDLEFEGTESFFLNLQNPKGLLIGNRQAEATILDDDAPPPVSLSITDATANEGKLNTKGKNSGTPQLTNLAFVVSLSAASSETISVAYRTVDDSATTADSDYRATSGILTFQPGQTSRAINVTILGDNTLEPDESFRVLLSGATQAGISDATGIGWIVNDDSNSKASNKGNSNSDKGSSEEFPIAIADPFWFFEDPDHSHHGHSHNDQEAVFAAESGPVPAIELVVDQQLLVSASTSMDSIERELLNEEQWTGVNAERSSLVGKPSASFRWLAVAQNHDSSPSWQHGRSAPDHLSDPFEVDSFFASFDEEALRIPT